MKTRMLSTMLLVGLVLTGCGTTTTSPVSGSQAANTAQSPTTTTSLKTQTVSLTVLPGGRLGPDQKMHDTFTTPDFTVVEGVPVTLTVYNFDTGQHTITCGDLHLNMQANGAQKDGVPGVTTVTFTPTKAGDFMWMCVEPCDGENNGWAMQHNGYMQGKINVVPFSNKQYVDLTIKDGLHYAAEDGKLHDSYSPASFTVQKGIPIQVTVENFDTGEHSITCPGLGLNQIMKGAKKQGVPTTTTFTFTPTKTGVFHWNCVIPCDNDGWAMGHDGYMAGTITVTG